MSRITTWLAATVVLMIFLTGYQLTVAGSGEEERRPPAVTDVQTTDPSGGPAVHPPK